VDKPPIPDLFNSGLTERVVDASMVMRQLQVR